MTEPSAIEIRRYASVAAFQVDAASMSAVGWSPVAQVESSGGVNVGWGLLAIVLALLGLLVFWPLLIGALLAGIGAVVARQKLLVVTYRPDALIESRNR